MLAMSEGCDRGETLLSRMTIVPSTKMVVDVFFSVPTHAVSCSTYTCSVL